MSELKKLKLDAGGFSILYVEDNNALRENAAKLLRKIFDRVYVASDGQEGLDEYTKNKPDIVITDIKMPHMDGLALAKHIKSITTETKVIIMSAFDDSEYLYNAIELGVFRYLKKPVNISALSEVLLACILEINKDRDRELFNSNLQSIFNYQSSIILMMNEATPSFVNGMFLEYFNVDTLEEFVEIYSDIGKLLLKHDSFLHGDSWFNTIKHNPEKLFNVKMQDRDKNFRHFILKYQAIPDKKGYGIISFDDITELNLLKLYDSQQVQSDNNLQNSKALFSLLEVIARNNAKVELHNFYKGVRITHDAIVMEVRDDAVILKTDYMQEKAIQFDRRSFITSDALPHVIACDNVRNIDFKHQSVEFSNIHFVLTSPVSRKVLRIVPAQSHSISLFIEKNKYHGDIIIEDLSLEAIRLNLESMPAGLELGDEVVVNIVVSLHNKPMIINVNAVLFSKVENRRSFSLVFTFHFEIGKRSDLAEYITYRQMEIIREFKGLQNG